MSIVLETPPAKNNQKPTNNNKKKTPKPQPQRRKAITNQRDVGPSNAAPSKRMKGHYNLGDVLSGERQSIYLDKVGLRGVPQLLYEFMYYEKWFVHNFELEFVPNQPLTVGGTAYAAPDYDPIDPFPLSAQYMSNSFNYVQRPITSGFRVKMPNFKLVDGAFVRPSLYTGANNNERLTSYGKFMIEATSSLDDGTSVGNLILHYDITYSIPQPYASDSISDQQLISLKSVCDNAGTVSVPPFTTSTVNDALLIYNTAHSAPTTLSNAYTYAGIIDKLTDMTLETVGGKDVYEGTRVYFKSPEFSLVSDVLTEVIATTAASISNLSLSRNFDTGNGIRLTRTADGWIDFADIDIIT